VTHLKKRIESAVPGVRDVVVTFTSKNDVRIECSVRPGEDSGVIAGRIYALRELDTYNIDLQLQLPLAEQKR
jgi:hypothetical protein